MFQRDHIIHRALPSDKIYYTGVPESTQFSTIYMTISSARNCEMKELKHEMTWNEVNMRNLDVWTALLGRWTRVASSQFKSRKPLRYDIWSILCQQFVITVEFVLSSIYEGDVTFVVSFNREFWSRTLVSEDELSVPVEDVKSVVSTVTRIQRSTISRLRNERRISYRQHIRVDQRSNIPQEYSR